MTTSPSRIKAAIRAYTVDAVDSQGKPVANGSPQEQALSHLADAVDTVMLSDGVPDFVKQILRPAMNRYLTASADATGELRKAADEFFGEDFRKSTDGLTMGDVTR